MHINLSKVVLTRAVGCSRFPVCPNNLTLIFELRSADCLESMPLLPSKTPRKPSSCKCNVSCFCERLPDVHSHLQPRWSRPTNNQSLVRSFDQNGVPDAIRTVGGACTPFLLRSLIRQDCRQLGFAAVLSFYPI